MYTLEKHMILPTPFLRRMTLCAGQLVVKASEKALRSQIGEGGRKNGGGRGGGGGESPHPAISLVLSSLSFVLVPSCLVPSRSFLLPRIVDLDPLTYEK